MLLPSNHVQKRYGRGVLIHFEDFGAGNAFRLLQRMRAARVPAFNDDIQCTAGVTVAAALAALRLPGVPPLAQQTFLFFGAGQANTGVAELLVRALVEEGLSEAQVGLILLVNIDSVASSCFQVVG